MLLTVREVTKSFPLAGAEDVQILEGVSLDLEKGETLALTGESGSGKSTLLHLIGGLDTPTSGVITLDGQEISAKNDRGRALMRRGTVGVVFQQFNLIPSLNVEANIAFQARLSECHDPVYAADLTKKLGLEEHIYKYPEALSGGQQQRVAIARTLAARPKLILADEPTGNLDEANADTVLSLMCEAAQAAGTALMMVTHSDKHAARMGRRLHLTHGRIVPGAQS
ncbi:MAG: ABC transporter ATP-binding protein [Litoreibacter sp.]